MGLALYSHLLCCMAMMQPTTRITHYILVGSEDVACRHFVSAFALYFQFMNIDFIRPENIRLAFSNKVQLVDITRECGDYFTPDDPDLKGKKQVDALRRQFKIVSEMLPFTLTTEDHFLNIIHEQWDEVGDASRDAFCPSGSFLGREHILFPKRDPSRFKECVFAYIGHGDETGPELARNVIFWKDIAAMLVRASRKTRTVIGLLGACHSGGIAGSQSFRGKSMYAAGAPSCGTVCKCEENDTLCEEMRALRFSTKPSVPERGMRHVTPIYGRDKNPKGLTILTSAPSCSVSLCLSDEMSPLVDAYIVNRGQISEVWEYFEKKKREYVMPCKFTCEECFEGH